MRFKPVFPGFYVATRSNINVYAIQTGSSVTLIDCGEPHFAESILSASAPLGKIETIIVTHAHRDHTGGLSEIARATGARVWMHEADAELIAQGQWIRPYTHAGTPLSWLLDNVIVKRYPETVSAFTDFELAQDQAKIDVAGGIRVHHMPGHCAGQVALEWKAPHGESVVIAGDVCMNVLGLTQPILYEDRSDGIASIGRLAALARSMDWVVFGHGPPLANPGPKLQRFHSRLTA
ncbi:MAG: MBL fold metallo-hydrolase [Pseudomonadota bacterium]